MDGERCLARADGTGSAHSWASRAGRLTQAMDAIRESAFVETSVHLTPATRNSAAQRLERPQVFNASRLARPPLALDADEQFSQQIGEQNTLLCIQGF